MSFIADLHIHSHYSRATSKDLNPEQLALWAQKKGITVVGTGDFTHPGWVSELQDRLEEAEEGLFKLKPDLQEAVDKKVPQSCLMPTRFLLSGEISCIYKKGDKTRKVHHLILMPDIPSVMRLNERLNRIGNITSDGRPILGLDSRDLLEIVLEASEKAFFIPAHVWTPWFSLFGSKSGFDTIEECFGDLTPHIHALETGLSSDPPMNRLLSKLDSYLLVSNSDAHSAAKLGREANIFETDLDYDSMVRAMTGGEGFSGTIEFYPEEGKYHLDGHRKCQQRLRPSETLDHNGLCPVCGRPVTVGVLHRIHELSDRKRPKVSKAFYSLIPLPEVLSEILRCGPTAKKVTTLYERLLMELGPELSMLMDLSLDQIGEAGGPVLKEAILRMREDRVIREEGYDGEYGNIRLFNETEMKSIAGQMALFAVETPKTPKKATPDVKLKRKPRAVSPTPAQQSLSVTDPILDPLNDEQKMAVLHEADNLLVVAGPGTGKTMTLTHRIAYVIRSNLAQANQVLALTFTRKAAQEMQERIHKLLEIPDKEEIRVSTFHGLCLDILRNNGDRIGLSLGFDLCTEMDADTLMRRVVTESGIDRRSIQRHVDNISRMRRSVVSKPSGSSDHPDTLTLLNEYRSRLREMGMQDLDGLEEEALGLLQDHPDIAESISKAYPRLFVDEYQDTNGIQVEILKRLYRPGKTHVFAIGDPDQSIYGFRGADVNNFHSFAEDFPDASEVTLLRNYRSTPFILEGAAAVMEKAEPLQSQQKDAAPIAIAPCNTEKEEAEMIVEQVERMIGGTTYFSLDSGRVDSHEGELSLGFGDMGVLFRLNAQGDAIEEAFGRAGIPFVRSGEKPLIRTYPVDVIWRFLQTVQRPDNPFYREAFEKLLKDYGLAKRDGDSIATEKVSVLKILDQAITLHHITCDTDEAADALRRLRHLAENFKENIEGLLDTLSLERGIDHALLLGDRVALMSLHAAKGLEWPVVFITGCEDRLLPCTLFGDKNDAEERRLFYVGMTRARFSLVLSYTGRRSLNGRMWEMGPSPFLAQIPEGISAPLDRRGWKSRKRPHKQLDFFSA